MEVKVKSHDAFSMYSTQPVHGTAENRKKLSPRLITELAEAIVEEIRQGRDETEINQLCREFQNLLFPARSSQRFISPETISRDVQNLLYCFTRDNNIDLDGILERLSPLLAKIKGDEIKTRLPPGEPVTQSLPAFTARSKEPARPVDVFMADVKEKNQQLRHCLNRIVTASAECVKKNSDQSEQIEKLTRENNQLKRDNEALRQDLQAGVPPKPVNGSFAKPASSVNNTMKNTHELIDALLFQLSEKDKTIRQLRQEHKSEDGSLKSQQAPEQRDIPAFAAATDALSFNEVPVKEEQQSRCSRQQDMLLEQLRQTRQRVMGVESGHGHSFQTNGFSTGGASSSAETPAAVVMPAKPEPARHLVIPDTDEVQKEPSPEFISKWIPFLQTKWQAVIEKVIPDSLTFYDVKRVNHNSDDALKYALKKWPVKTYADFARIVFNAFSDDSPELAEEYGYLILERKTAELPL